MKSSDIIKKIIQDVRVELLDEFDRNFERKGFFDKPWPKNKMPNKRGSSMMRTGALRKGNRATVQGTNITFSNSQPYASLQNNGGVIVISPQMKKFFWAMFYKTSGGAAQASGKNKRSVSEEAEWWKRLAMKKVGDKITIQQRKFIGSHPELRRHIERIMNNHLKDIDEYIKNKLKR